MEKKGHHFFLSVSGRIRFFPVTMHNSLGIARSEHTGVWAFSLRLVLPFSPGCATLASVDAGGDIRFFGGYEIVLLYHWLGLAVKAHPVFLPFFSIPRPSPIFSHQCSRPKPAPRPSDTFIDSNGGPGIFYGKIPGKDLTSGNKCVTIWLQVQSHDLGGTYGS